MDINNLPIGFTMGLAMNERAMQNYGKLTEAEKEKILMECRGAKNKSEMTQIIDRLEGRLF